MAYESLKKNGSSWSPAHQPARENPFAPRPYNPQPQQDTDLAAEPEPYSREPFDLISSKFFSTPNTVQPKPAPEVQESELESEQQEDKLEKDAVALPTRRRTRKSQ